MDFLFDKEKFIQRYDNLFWKFFNFTKSFLYEDMTTCFENFLIL